MDWWNDPRDSRLWRNQRLKLYEFEFEILPDLFVRERLTPDLIVRSVCTLLTPCLRPTHHSGWPDIDIKSSTFKDKMYFNPRLAFKWFHLQFFSVALVHFSDQNWNSQNYLFNLHISVSLVHMKKTVSHLFEHVANALVFPCTWLCTILCSFLHYQLLISSWSKCIAMVSME